MCTDPGGDGGGDKIMELERVSGAKLCRDL